MRKLLVLTPEPLSGASSRLRAIDLIPYWSDACLVRHIAFLSERSFRLKEQSGRLLSKSLSVLLDLIVFLVRIVPALFWAEVLLVHRNVLPLGPPWVEWLFKRLGKKLIFDFDDAIYINPATARNQWLAPLKMNARRTEWLATHADAVIVGNDNLAEYVENKNDQIRIMQTGLDLAAYGSATGQGEQKILGWVGGPGTSPFVEQLLPVLESLLDQHEDWQVCLVGATFDSSHDRIASQPWQLSTELDVIGKFSIGLNPLEDNVFTRGKCGFKVAQYQALGIPVVSSPVGVCSEQVVPNVNGFLAETPEAWSQHLDQLMTDSDMRQRMAEASKESGASYDRSQIANEMLEVILSVSR